MSLSSTYKQKAYLVKKNNNHNSQKNMVRKDILIESAYYNES